MTPLLTVQLKQSKARTALSEHLAIAEDQRGEDWAGELSKRTEAVASLEREYQAALLLEDQPAERREQAPEEREWRDLVRRANVGEMVDCIIAHAAYTGANEEVRSQLGLDGNMIPLSLLREIERRAVVTSPGEVGQGQQPITPYVFPASVAAFLGIDMPSVGVGEAVFPVLTSELDVHTPAPGAAAAETTGTFSVDVLSPARLQASFFYNREDRARFAGLDTALRENLSAGLADGLDAQIVAGPNGLLTGTNLPNNAADGTADFAKYVSGLAYGRVDGRYASTTAALRIALGAQSYAHAGGVYRNASVDRTALDRLMELTGGVRVSAHVPAAAGDPAKQNALVRLGMTRDAVAPTWEGVTIIPDEITKAGEGQIVLTAVMLFAVKVLRKDGFHKQELQIA